MATQASTAADVLVIFGITGDLAKKMTFRSLYRLERRQMLQCPIVGVAATSGLPRPCGITHAAPLRTPSR